MTATEEKVLPYLFMVLLGFILVNLALNICLYSFSRIKNIKTLCWYWLSLLLVYLIQGKFQESPIQIMLSFSWNILPVMIASKILFDSLSMGFPYKRYFAFWLLGLSISSVLLFLGIEFTGGALPVCVALATPFFEPAVEVLFTQRKRTSVLQKFMGLIYVIGGIHLINFALFRMVPGTQIQGFGTAIALYQILSLGLMAFAFEEYSKTEKQRLQTLVAERTEELTRTLKVKDTLFKVVLHDIANPINAQGFFFEKLKRGMPLTEDTLGKLVRLMTVIKEVIRQVRSIEVIDSGELNIELRPVNLQQCLDDLKLIFEGPLAKKDLRLTIHNELPQGSFFLADQNAFTTSIMCNLVSNAIKFSPPHKELVIRAFLKNSKIVIEVEDQGIGMPQEMALGVFDPSKKSSRLGTLGEVGTGYGMPLVKSFVDYFGGHIQVESRSMDSHPMDHGTKITLTLDQGLSH